MKSKCLPLSLQGIQFIHTSDLKYHGALRSDTCLLNDRYTIRIALVGFKHAALKVLQHGRKKWHQQIFEPLKETVTLDYQGQDIGSLGLIILEMFHTSIPKQGRHQGVETPQDPSKSIKILKTNSVARLTWFEGRGHKKVPKGPPFAYVFWKNFKNKWSKERVLTFSPLPPLNAPLKMKPGFFTPEKNER